MGGRWLNRQKDWLKEYQPAPAVIEEKAEVYGVRYIPLRCPRCKSKDVKCYASKPPVRYHVCKKCKYNFKSFEVEQ